MSLEQLQIDEEESTQNESTSGTSGTEMKKVVIEEGLVRLEGTVSSEEPVDEDFVLKLDARDEDFMIQLAQMMEMGDAHREDIPAIGPVPIDEFLPFFDGTEGLVHKVSSEIAVAMITMLRESYEALEPRRKRQLHRAFKKRGLLRLCEACWTFVLTPSEFVEHILTDAHVINSVMGIGLQFSFKKDYVTLEKMISNTAIPDLFTKTFYYQRRRRARRPRPVD